MALGGKMTSSNRDNLVKMHFAIQNNITEWFYSRDRVADKFCDNSPSQKEFMEITQQKLLEVKETVENILNIKI